VRRLVYAPKVWVFIRSSNILDEKGDPRIYDVSSDIVRGSVTQNLGDLSKARFELRNRFRKWIRSPSDGSKQIFLPMDLVTIWMQRIPGHPVQVFTGYLDSVPYYQAYPGNAIFEASCTLKKLAFNWFDPGLPVFRNWMQANGWAYDPTTGNVLAQTQGNTNSPKIASDASFADLLGRFLVDIAGWSPKDIVISNMPVGIAAKATELYTSVEDATEQTLQDLSGLMGKLLGVSGVTGVDNSPDAAPDDDSVAEAVKNSLPSATLAEVRKVSAAATASSLPPWLLIFAGLLATHFRPDYHVTDTSNPAWGYGLYALRPNSGGLLSGVPIIGSGNDQIDGVAPERVMDPTLSATLFAKRLNKNRTDKADKALGGDVQAAREWVEAALGRNVSPPDTLDNLYKVALQASGTQKTDVGKPSATISVDVKNTPLTGDFVKARVTPADFKVIQSGSLKDAVPELGAALIQAKSIAPNIQVRGGTTNPLDLVLTGSEKDLARLWSFYKGKPEYQRIELLTASTHVALDNGVTSGIPLTIGNPPAMLVKVNVPLFDKLGTLTLTDPLLGGDAVDAAGVEGGITFKQLAAFSANAAFASNFAFPADFIASNVLVGDKALMNDVSCLKGVQQFCAASLRTFRSLPDGRFMAFYPDYFGASRDPYWKIYDIEIVDFGIQLNDDALATHVYVIGDSFAGVGEMQEAFQQAASRGLATLTQPGMLDAFIVPLNMTNDAQAREGGDSDSNVTMEEARLSNAFNFLEHYGARPHKEDQPLIRNPFYEFLMAWQRFMQLWAQQFATTVQFSFQPEVMAGGLIEFPQHHIQMFCDSVTHSFDYQGGFTTQATLTAPSVSKGKANASATDLPGFALGGTINTVGAA